MARRAGYIITPLSAYKNSYVQLKGTHLVTGRPSQKWHGLFQVQNSTFLYRLSK